LYGHGVRADKTIALAWFERALEQGDARAAEMVKQLAGKVPSTQFTSDGAGVQVKFTDATEVGKNFGIVGVGEVAPHPDESWARRVSTPIDGPAG
jgi:TPR repeat protein